MYSNIKKISKVTTISDLLERRQRNKFVNFFSITDPLIRQKLLLSQDGTNPSFFERKSKRGLTIVTASSSGGLLGSIKIIGYTVGTITQADIDAFKQQFGLKYGVSPSLLTITLTPGSLIVGVSVNPVPDISALSLSDKSFFSNLDAIFNSISALDIDTLITDSNLTANITPTGTPLTIDTTYTTINTSLDIVEKCKNDSEYKKRDISEFICPLVGDPVNNCMYSMVRLKPSAISVVKISNNGLVSKICTYSENQAAISIFINIESTYLIIPSNIRDTTSPNAIDLSQYFSKVYLINIATGAISIITLTELNQGTGYGFDKLTRRFFYRSAMASQQFEKLCYVTIPADYSSATLSGSYFVDVSKASVGRIQFVSSIMAYCINGLAVYVLDLSQSAGAETLIAGFSGVTDNGSWSNTNINEPKQWYSPRIRGPFLNAALGSNAWFSGITDMAYDSVNNRLLVTDEGSNRIRSVDLTSGNNYEVTTLAGTSPTFSGLAVNNANTASNPYSQPLLDTLLQVGEWGYGNMPAYTQINGTFSNSTFNRPIDITIFNRKTYVRQYDGKVRQLSNGSVSSFTTTLLFTD